MADSIGGDGRSSEPPIGIEVLHERLRAAVEAIESGEQWRAWLDFARNLHQYSFNNLILIWTQRPDATAVASYRTWQSVDRQVRRGEKALRVLAPIIRRAIVTDVNGQPVREPDGRTQVKQEVVGFRPAPVFDITQTDGPPLPQPARPVLLAGQAPDGLWDGLVREVNERGYRLRRGPAADLHGANGLTRTTERDIWVRDDIDDAQAVKTLAHELGHVLLHTQQDAGPGRVSCTGLREVEAESVAHLVLAAHHLDTGAYSFPYVAAWAYPLAAVEHVPLADIITRTGTRVTRAAHDIINATTTATDSAQGPAVRALTARVTIGSRQAADLRDQASAAALPPVERTVLLAVVADSHDFFRSQLAGSWVPDYLADRRLAGAVDSHQLGYAPRRWTTLTDHLRSLGYTDDHIEAAGMASRARNGHLIDRFRDRLTVPLRDHQGDLVGFTARLAAQHSDDRDGPKYLNSPTTALFRKRELLYGLGEHRAQIVDGHRAVLCEGPLDAIAVDLLAAETGTQLVGLAAIGTAFTDQYAHHLLAAVGDPAICLALDADQAGQAATEAVWRKLTEGQPRDIVATGLPAGTDPAALFCNEPQLLAHHIHDARPAATVIAEHQINIANLDGNFLRELAAFRDLTSLADRMPVRQRVGYLLRLAERLHIDPADAAAEVAQYRPGMLLDRALDHCQQLENALRESRPHPEMPAASESRSAILASPAHSRQAAADQGAP